MVHARDLCAKLLGKVPERRRANAKCFARGRRARSGTIKDALGHLHVHKGLRNRDDHACADDHHDAGAAVCYGDSYNVDGKCMKAT